MSSDPFLHHGAGHDPDPLLTVRGYETRRKVAKAYSTARRIVVPIRLPMCGKSIARATVQVGHLRPMRIKRPLIGRAKAADAATGEGAKMLAYVFIIYRKRTSVVSATRRI